MPRGMIIINKEGRAKSSGFFHESNDARREAYRQLREAGFPPIAAAMMRDWRREHREAAIANLKYMEERRRDG